MPVSKSDWKALNMFFTPPENSSNAILNLTLYLSLRSRLTSFPIHAVLSQDFKFDTVNFILGKSSCYYRCNILTLNPIYADQPSLSVRLMKK